MSQSPLHKLSPKGELDDSSLLRILIDSLPEQVYVKDKESRYVVNNIAHVRALGASSPEEVVGKRDSDFYPEELAERYRVREQEIVLSGRPLIDSEEPSMDAEGNERWHSTTNVPLRDGSGEIVGLVGVTRDVTEHKEAEEALRESEERFRSTFENAPIGVALVGLDRRYFKVNHALCEMLGYSEKELLEMSSTETIHPEDHEISARRLCQVLQDEMRSYIVERRYVHADGHVVWNLVSVSLIRDSQDNPSHFVCLHQDVTERKKAEEELKESEERFRSLTEAAFEGIAINENGKILDANWAYADMFGYEVPEVRGMSVLKLHPPEARDEVRHRVYSGYSEPYESEGLKKDGTTFDIEIRGRTISYEDRFVRITAIRDITERRRAEEALRESEARFRTAFEDAPVGVALVGLDGCRLKVNRALCEMLGRSEEELLGKAYLEVVHPEDREISAERLRQLLEKGEGSYTLERRYTHAEGHAVWNLTSVSLIQDSQGDPSHFVCLHQDITKRKYLEERLEHRAFHDSLTGLPNRALFLDRLGHALSRSSREEGPVAVLFVDLDDFKMINDSLGHDAGNVLLVEVAERLRATVRPGDTVARLFGDEFAVLLEAPAGMEEAHRVMERIGERLQALFVVEGQEAHVSTSVGIALSETPEDKPEDLLRHADLAMYEAKSRGKAEYEVYNPSINIRVVERMDLEKDLRRAVEREEFEVHYQPKVWLETGAIVGVEALVRWKHPDRGLLLPAQFIPIAEQTGLIEQIGLWVLKESCRQVREWQERHPARLSLPFGLCVNLSARQIKQPDLAEKVAEVLRETDLAPECLVLEISERTAMEDAEQTIVKLRELKDLGVRLAIDDFGTGYCSLVYLEHSLLDVLKIDRVLIHREREDPKECATIIFAMTNMAHSLGLTVIVEGVETEWHHAKLKEMGCEMAQGYYFAKPLPSDALETLLQEYVSF